MSPPEPLRIFISYARKDGADLARRLQTDLKGLGFDPWLDTQRLRGGATWTREIEVALDRANYVLLLLSNGSYVSEICRSEQLRALRKGTCVIPLKAQSDTDIPLHLEAKNFRDFSDPTQYAPQFEILLGDIRGNVSAVLPERYRATPIQYLTAPPRVANYLMRPQALRALRDTLFAEDDRQPIALTALAGMGGIGKTVLAKALTDDEVVQRAFPDGIVWITAGKERKRDFIEEMREVAKALGDDPSSYDTALACENQYRTTVAQKAALIVVDDVWSKSDIEPLLADSPRSRFLFTTRDASIGRFVAAREHRADLLDALQARELLSLWANMPTNKLPATADDIIAQCGCLPLALSVVGAMLRDTDAQFWAATLNLLRNANLSAIEDQLPEGQQSFFKAVEVSFKSLKPGMQERYKELAVLLEDMSTPPEILQMLWKVDRDDAARIAKSLIDRSLTQFDDASKGIRLHDLQLDYVRAQFPDREALALIHGAIRLSAHVITKDPYQFPSQMVGRLLLHYDLAAIKQFAETIAQGATKLWLRPTHATLHPPGTSLVRTLQGHTDRVRGVALSGDGRRAVSASYDRTMKVWDVETGLELRTFRGHTDTVRGVALSGDGHRAVSTSDDRTLKVWDVETGRELRTLQGHTGSIHSVALSRDGRRAVSASDDRTLRVWDVESGRELKTLLGHAGIVYSVALSEDGRRAVSASDDRTVKMWDVETGRELHTFQGHTGFVYGVALSENGRRAASSSYDQTLKVWDAETKRELRTLRGHTNWVNSLALSRDGRRAVSASYDQTLKVWDVETGRELRTLRGHTNRVNSVALSGDGRCAVSASYDRTLKVWDVETGRELRTLQGHTNWVRGVALTGDGRHAVSASGDQTLKVWDVETGHELRTLQGHTGSVNSVALSGDGCRVVSASGDQTLKVWDVETGHELRTLRGHTRYVNGVALSWDGCRAVSASYDRTLKVWDVETGRDLRTLPGHTDAVRGVALSGDGCRVVSASDDHTLKVWDVETGEVGATFTCDGAAYCCAFIDDDQFIAGDAGGNVHFLRLEQPKCKN